MAHRPLFTGAAFRDIVEEGEQPIKILLSQRIVLVVVATSTARRKSQPHRACSLHPIDNVLNPPFFGNDSAFGIKSMVAAESGGELLLVGGVGQEVACDLVHREHVI